MNQKIKKILNALFIKNYSEIKNVVLSSLFDQFLSENKNPKNKAFDVNLGVLTSLFDDYEVKQFKKAKKNKYLIDAFNNVKTINLNDDEIVAKLYNDINTSLIAVNNKVKLENKGYSNQVIILEYDHEPVACLSGFGKGDYPILESPNYFKINAHEELYAGIGKIDYRNIWDNLLKFNDLLEDLDIYDQVFDTDVYQALLKSYQYKTYLLLHEAFNKIDIESYKGLDIEKPLYIFGNEHDCESINIYVFE